MSPLSSGVRFFPFLSIQLIVQGPKRLCSEDQKVISVILLMADWQYSSARRQIQCAAYSLPPKAGAIATPFHLIPS